MSVILSLVVRAPGPKTLLIEVADRILDSNPGQRIQQDLEAPPAGCKFCDLQVLCEPKRVNESEGILELRRILSSRSSLSGSRADSTRHLEPTQLSRSKRGSGKVLGRVLKGSQKGSEKGACYGFYS